MPRAILFGFEGGLVDPVGPRLEALESVLVEAGIALSRSGGDASAPAPPYEDWLAVQIERARGRPDRSLAARLMVRAADRYRARVSREGPAWLAGALDLVGRCTAAGLTLGVVSELSRTELVRSLAGSPQLEQLRVLAAAEDLDEGETRADAYRRALVRLNTEPPLPERLIHPHEVVAIEGSREGALAAAEAGLVAIAVGAVSEPLPAGVRAVASLTEVELHALDSG